MKARTRLQRRLFSAAGFVFLLAAASVTRAEILLDVEADPLPLVDITVVIPAGFEAAKPEEAGAAILMGDVIDAGTQKLDREAFLDRLASYGASHDFTVSNLFSVWTLSFPVVDGKDYAALGALLADNWKAPRLTTKTFRIATRKLESSLKGSLDADMGLGVSTSRRWINSRHLGGHPITVDSVAKLERKTLAMVWDRDFLAAPEAWAGVVAPPSSLPLVKTILSSVFARQGAIVEGAPPRPLALRTIPADGLRPEKVFLILDKPDRTQTMTSVIAVSSMRHKWQDELAAAFGNHVLVDNGLGSIFGDEIRTKRGLAYAVSGVEPRFLGFPSVGLATNPVRPKTDEALGVVAGLVTAAYEKGSLIDELPTESWTRQWKSFIYGKLLERSSPDGRISERMAVATGDLSPKLYERDVDDWRTDRLAVTTTLRKTWAESVVVGAVVGQAKELRPLVEKHFPGYRVVVIPYRDAVRSKTYRATPPG
jgi:predicted Zn-dependent peptidase